MKDEKEAVRDQPLAWWMKNGLLMTEPGKSRKIQYLRMILKAG